MRVIDVFLAFVVVACTGALANPIPVTASGLVYPRAEGGELSEPSEFETEAPYVSFLSCETD